MTALPFIGNAFPMWMTYLIILGAVLCYMTEKLSLELTSILVVIALILLFEFFPVALEGAAHLDAEQLLAGFANPALVTIICLLIIGQGLFQTGALNEPVRRLLLMTRRRHALLLMLSLIFALVISAFINNTPVAVIFIPVMALIAGRMRMSPSRVMIPLSYACILGGMITLIGSSTNLLVAGAAAKAGHPPIGFFDFTVPGIVLAAAGLGYVLFVLPHLLPDHKGPTGVIDKDAGRQFIVEIPIGPEHPLIGHGLVAGIFKELPDVTIRLVQRRGEALLPPFDDLKLELNDQLIVAATHRVLTDILSTRPQMLVPLSRRKSDLSDHTSNILVEAMVTPTARIVGLTLDRADFDSRTGSHILGIQRRRHMRRGPLKNTRLQAGDMLLLIGPAQTLSAVRETRDLLLLEGSVRELPALGRAYRALAIFAGVICLSAFGLLPIVTASLIGAAAMVASKCLNFRQAWRSIDMRIVMVVGASLAMGQALSATGGASAVASVFVGAFMDAGPAVVLSMLFALVAVLTNLLSNNATAVLFTPIALSTAHQMQLDPTPFLFAVLFGANMSFVTPMGYQTNLLVLGPGHYSFRDYVKAGFPLAVLLWIVFSLFVPFYFGYL